MDLAARQLLLQELAQPVDVGALLADDDARLRGVDRDLDLVDRALDLDLGDAGALQLVADDAANLEILVQLLGVGPAAEPVRLPAMHDPEPEADRIDLASHVVPLTPLLVPRR